MRPTFMGMETAKKAIFLNQKSIDITGNNLANSDTTGYTRQRVERAPTPSISANNRVAANRIALQGQGVDALGVSQMRDSFLDKRFRDEYAKASYHGQSASILNDIQSALGDGNNLTDESGLSGAIADIYSALNDFISEPTMTTQANIVMASFKNMTQVLQQLDNNLNNIAFQRTEDLQVSVDRVNTIVSQIANLNKIISGDATVLTDPDNEHYRPNELLDQRNLLLDELASYGNIQVKDKADGSVDVEMDGHALVHGGESDSIRLQRNSDKTISLQWRTTGKDVSLNGGALQASVHFINGRGLNVQSNNEEPYRGIPYYRDQIDTFARTLAETVNKVLPEYDAATDGPKKDANGDIVYKTLLGSKDGNSVTAANISLSTEWMQGGADYFIFNKEQNVEDYAQNIATLLKDTPISFTSHGETFKGTFSDFEINFLGTLGSDISFHEGRQESYALVADDFQGRRDSISGVSRDEETADMIKFQKSYEAAARLMTVLDDLIDVIVNRMGRVGL